MTHPSDTNCLFGTIPTNSPAIKVLGLWFGLLVFFFSPDIIHAEYLDQLDLLNHLFLE